MVKLQIESLDQYIDALHACESEDFDYKDVAESAEVPMTNIAHLIKWDADKYTRLCIEKTDKFELVLLCWAPGQASKIHNHNGEEGWMKIIQGKLTEQFFTIGEVDRPLEPSKRRLLLKNHTYYVNDENGVHKIANNSTEKCISLHLYAQPVERYVVYNETTGARTKMDFTCDKDN